MKIKNALTVILLIAFSTLLATPYFGDSITEKTINELVADEATEFEIEITDFSNFTIYENDTLVNSTNFGNRVYFEYNGNASERITENYIYHLDDYGNCSYYEMYVSYNYSMKSLVDTLNFKVIAASYYSDNGTFLENESYVGEHRNLNFAGIWDPSDSQSGTHIAVGYPNDAKERFESGINTMTLSGSVTEHIVRNESGTYSELYNNNNDQMLVAGFWATGITKPMNYLTLAYSNLAGNYANVSVYDIDATLRFGPFNHTDHTPNVTIYSPVDNGTFNTTSLTIYWSGYDLDNDIVKYYVRIGSTPWIDVFLAKSFTFSGLADGVYVAEVKVVDSNMNYNTDTITFTIKTTETSPPISSSSTGITVIFPGFTTMIALVVFVTFWLSVLLVRNKRKGPY